MHPVFTALRIHLVPIAFILGTLVLVTTSTFELATGRTILLDPLLGYGIAACYLVLGLLYEWSIRQQQRIQARRTHRTR